mmetsp:Transcript_12785/g.31965  ORF Transcript_12785/g.31965 Transcript_12785/m.31965 type:complete len:439 (-) Transcript_12785:197-1513(-)
MYSVTPVGRCFPDPGSLPLRLIDSEAMARCQPGRPSLLIRGSLFCAVLLAAANVGDALETDAGAVGGERRAGSVDGDGEYDLGALTDLLVRTAPKLGPSPSILGSGSGTGAARAADELSAGVAAPDGGEHRLRRVAAELQQLAFKVISGAVTLSKSQRAVLESIREEMKQIVESAPISHAEDQHEVDRARDQVAECSINSTRINSAANAATSSASIHAACREEEQQHHITKINKCDLYNSVASTLPSPECIAKGQQQDGLEGWVEWAMEQNSTLLLKQAACEDAEEYHAEHGKKCSQLQSDYEMAFCTYRDILTASCSSYTTCRSDALTVQKETHAAVRVTEAARKAEYTAATQINCYIGVFEVSAEEQPVILQECDVLIIATSDFDIMFHEHPPALDCDTTPVEVYPCSDQWLNDHYKSKTWYPEAPTAVCSACVDV